MSQLPMKDVLDRFAAQGWAHIPAGATMLPALLDALRLTCIHETQVVVRPGRALVTSADALDFQTDHHRAEVIAWTCHVQTSEGGASVLADALAAWQATPDDDRALLARLELFEHSVFPGDRSTHPFVEDPDGTPRFYCSFWFDAPPEPAVAGALERWKRQLRQHQVASLRLAPGDVLLIDNRRILHARTAITGSRDRHLTRQWFARTERW